MNKIMRIVLIFFIVAGIVTICVTISNPPSVEEVYGISDALYDSSGIDANRFYYEQLTDVEKQVYENLLDATESFINNKPIFCCSMGDFSELDAYCNYIKNAILAYQYDTPLSYIWLKYLNVSIYSEKNNLYIVPSSNKYGDLEPEETRKAIKEVELEAKEFVSDLSGTDAEKLLRIYDWIMEKTDYDETISLPNIQNAYGAVISGHSICVGFASTYKYLADLAGIDTLYVVGQCSQGSSEPSLHAWNMVYLGEWRIVDVTFGDGSWKRERHDFFLISADDLYYQMYHPDDKFVYPSIH